MLLASPSALDNTMLELFTALALATLPSVHPAEWGSYGEPAPGCLTGRVLDDTTRPLADAKLVLLAHAGAVVARSTTDRAGSFVLADIAPGGYWLVVERLGFEPEIVSVELGPRQAWTGEIRLPPLTALVQLQEGRFELPWLVRGTSRDPLRWQADQPVHGRVAWNTFGGDGATGSSVQGQRAQLSLQGALRRDVRWFANGRLDDLLYRETEAGVAEAAEAVHRRSHQLQYGVDLRQHGHDLMFRGELSRLSGEVDSAPGLSSLDELRQSYAVDFRSNGAADLGFGLSYHEAVRGDSDYGTADRHSIWEGRGRFVRDLDDDDRHQIRTRFLVRAQSFTTPNNRLLASLLPVTGMLYDRDLNPSPWQVLVGKAYAWRIDPALALLGGLDLAYIAGDGGGGYLRPRLGGELDLDRRTRLEAAASLLMRSPRSPVAGTGRAPDPGSRTLGFEVAIERDLDGGELRIEAARNAHRELVDLEPGTVPHSEYLVFSPGAAESHELSVDLSTVSSAGLRGFAGATIGSASGELAFLPVSFEPPLAVHPRIRRGDFYYASARIGGELPATRTDVVVRYRWLEGDEPNGEDYERIDIELDQGLPFTGLGGARIDLQLALRGYLRRPELPPDEDRLPVFLPSPLITAGVAVRF